MKWLCRFIGHGVSTVQSDELSHWLHGDSWVWPGVVTFCPRCGMVYRNAARNDQEKINPPWFTKEDSSAAGD